MSEKLIAQITTQGIIKNQKNQILLLRRNKPGGLFTLPGGTIQQDEDIKAGLQRELKEETGLDLTIGGPIWVWQSNHIGRDLVGIVFVAQEVLIGEDPTILSAEHSEAKWFEVAELFTSAEVDPYIKRDELRGI